MPHPYPIREIARQSGLSEATVDRVLNKRPGVRPSTAANVAQAITDLDRQRSQLRLNGRTFIVDLVMQTPDRFSAAVKSALELELPMLRPAVVRSRFDFRETGAARRARERPSTTSATAVRWGSSSRHPTSPRSVMRSDGCTTPGFRWSRWSPTSRLSQRVAYVGIDNRAAGATAAYLIDQWLTADDDAILMALSRSAFRGEEEREMGFRTTMRERAAGRALIEATDTDGHRHGRPRPDHLPPSRTPPDHRGLLHRRRKQGDPRRLRGRGPAVPGVRRSRPRPGQPVADPEPTDHRGAPPRPAARHAPRLSGDHASQRGHRRTHRVRPVTDQCHHARTTFPRCPIASARGSTERAPDR